MSRQRIFAGEPKTLERGVRHLYGSFTTTTSGTLSTTAITSRKHAGFTLTKTSTKTGRYTVQLDKNYGALLFVDAVLVGPDDSAFTDAKGQGVGVRNIDVSDGTTNDGTFEIQFRKNTDSSDAEVEDGAIIMIHITVRDAHV